MHSNVTILSVYTVKLGNALQRLFSVTVLSVNYHLGNTLYYRLYGVDYIYDRLSINCHVYERVLPFKTWIECHPYEQCLLKIKEIE